jgi:UDP-N-acetylmuramoylalanine--D-glutamate ligase
VKALVIGVGIAGTASLRLLRAQGAEVTVADDERAPLPRLPAAIDVVVPSPGVPPSHHLLAQARRRRIAVWSEIELAARSWTGRTVAVTGTNGKSSVVTIVADSLSRSGIRARAAGNIGAPLGAAVLEEPSSTVLVVEVSSFQLQYCLTFAPHVSAVLNVTLDHLDWHGTSSRYRAAKARIFAAQGPEAWAVVNSGDPGARALSARVSAQLCRYRRARPAPGGLGVEEGSIVADDAAPGGGGRLARLDELGLGSPHQIDNALAVLAIVRAVDPRATAAAREAISSFPGLPHLSSVVKTVRGVTFVDDSKATNPSAAGASLLGHASVILIAGGRSKGLPFREMADAARARVRAVIGIGEAGPELLDLFGEQGIVGEKAETMSDAVRRAASFARAGDTVLLAPGCASFDMFSGQAARGDAFVAAVRELDVASVALRSGVVRR